MQTCVIRSGLPRVGIMATMELQPIRNHEASKTADSRINLDSSPSRGQPNLQDTPKTLHLLRKYLLSNKDGGKGKERKESGERKTKEGERKENIDKREMKGKQGMKNEEVSTRSSLSLGERRSSEVLNQDGAKEVGLPDPVAEPSEPTEPSMLYAGAEKAYTSAPVVANHSSKAESTFVADVTARKPVEITFDRSMHDDIGSKWFRAPRENIPEDLIGQWEPGIRESLDSYIHGLMGDTSAGFGMRKAWSWFVPKPEVEAISKFVMAGPRYETKLRIQPTILVYCTDEGLIKKIEEHLANSKPGFLDNFDWPIKVCYKNGDWAAASLEQTQIGALNPLLENQSLVRTVFIEHNTAAEGFGLRLRFEIQAANLMQTCYSRLGGILYINGLYYGMTTAHTLFIPSKSIGTITEDLPLSYEGAVSPSSAAGSAPSDSLHPSGSDSLYESPKVQSEWLVLRNPLITWSFQGRRTKFREGSVFHSPSINDWALIPISSAPHFVYGSNNGLSRPLHLIQELKLHAGHVSIRRGTDKSCEGFLTQTSSSLHTWDSVIVVREILLDVELFEGASGSWVLRDDGVCGYIVAVMGSKLSCLMIPMERAFQDIEDVLGSEVQFSPNKEHVIISATDDTVFSSDAVVTPVDPVIKPDDGARSRKRTSSRSYQAEHNAFRLIAEQIGYHHQRGDVSTSMAQDICTIYLAWTGISNILKTERESIPLTVLTVYMANAQQLLRSLDGNPIPGSNIPVPPIVVRSLYYLRGLPKRTREHAAASTRLLQIIQAEVIKYPELRRRFLVTTAHRPSKTGVDRQIANLW